MNCQYCRERAAYYEQPTNSNKVIKVCPRHAFMNWTLKFLHWPI